jgi:hypothetical protein
VAVDTKYFKVTQQLRDAAEFDQVLSSGTVLFAVEVPSGFELRFAAGINQPFWWLLMLLTQWQRDQRSRRYRRSSIRRSEMSADCRT